MAIADSVNEILEFVWALWPVWIALLTIGLVKKYMRRV